MQTLKGVCVELLCFPGGIGYLICLSMQSIGTDPNRIILVDVLASGQGLRPVQSHGAVEPVKTATVWKRSKILEYIVFIIEHGYRRISATRLGLRYLPKVSLNEQGESASLVLMLGCGQVGQQSGIHAGTSPCHHTACAQKRPHQECAKQCTDYSKNRKGFSQVK